MKSGLKVLIKGKEFVVSPNWMTQVIKNGKVMLVPFLKSSDLREVLDTVWPAWQFVVTDKFMEENCVSESESGMSDGTNTKPANVAKKQCYVFADLILKEGDTERRLSTVGVGKDYLSAYTRAFKRAAMLIGIDLKNVSVWGTLDTVNRNKVIIDGKSFTINSEELSQYLNTKMFGESDTTSGVTTPASQQPTTSAFGVSPTTPTKNTPDKIPTTLVKNNDSKPTQSFGVKNQLTMGGKVANSSGTTPKTGKEWFNMINSMVDRGLISAEEVKRIKKYFIGDVRITADSPEDVLERLYYLIKQEIQRKR